MMSFSQKSKVLDELHYAIGQKLMNIKVNDTDIWLIFEKDIIKIRQIIECRCIDCVEKHEGKVVRG